MDGGIGPGKADDDAELFPGNGVKHFKVRAVIGFGGGIKGGEIKQGHGYTPSGAGEAARLRVIWKLVPSAASRLACHGMESCIELSDCTLCSAPV